MLSHVTHFSRSLCHACTGKPPLIEAPASLPAKNNSAAFRPRDFSCCVRVFQNFSSSVHEARSGRYHGPGFGVPGASGAAFTSRETDYGMPDAAPDSGPPMFMCVVTTLLPAERLPLFSLRQGSPPSRVTLPALLAAPVSALPRATTLHSQAFPGTWSGTRASALRRGLSALLHFLRDFAPLGARYLLLNEPQRLIRVLRPAHLAEEGLKRLIVEP